MRSWEEKRWRRKRAAPAARRRRERSHDLRHSWFTNAEPANATVHHARDETKWDSRYFSGWCVEDTDMFKCWHFQLFTPDIIARALTLSPVSWKGNFYPVKVTVVTARPKTGSECHFKIQANQQSWGAQTEPLKENTCFALRRTKFYNLFDERRSVNLWLGKNNPSGMSKK